jgi:hypothetical protein
VEFLKTGATVNAQRHVQILKQSDDLPRQEVEPSPQSPYSLKSESPDFHIFGPLKDAIRRRRFAEDDDKLKHSGREELRRFSKDLYANGVQRLAQRCKIYVGNKEDCGKIIAPL